MKFTGVYCVVVGILMLAQWAFFIIAGQVPELKTEPIGIAFHLAAEAITALGLIFAGFGLLNKKVWAQNAARIMLGMLIYTVIVSPGYFAQQGAWYLVVMFALLLILAIISLIQLARSAARP